MKQYEVSWYENGSKKVLGPYTFSQAVKLAQKLYVNPDIVGLSIQEVTE